MTYQGTNVDPGDDLTLSVAGDVVGSTVYQALKLIDATEGSTTPVGTQSNPLRTDPTGSTIQPVEFTPTVSTSATEGRVTVTDTPGGTSILAANPNRVFGQVRVALDSAQGVYIKRGASADTNARYYGPGDIIELVTVLSRYTGAVFGFVSSGTATVEYTEIV